MLFRKIIRNFYKLFLVFSKTKEIVDFDFFQSFFQFSNSKKSLYIQITNTTSSRKKKKKKKKEEEE